MTLPARNDDGRNGRVCERTRRGVKEGDRDRTEAVVISSLIYKNLKQHSPLEFEDVETTYTYGDKGKTGDTT